MMNMSIKKSNKKLTLEHCQEIAKQKGGVLLSSEYINGHSHLLWRCKYGHEWNANIESIKHQHSWCPFCVGKGRSTLQTCKDLAKLRGGECLSTEYRNNRDKLQWKCNIGHIWLANLKGIKDKKYWCPVCGKINAKKTCIEKFGVPNPTQNREIAIKASKSSNRFSIKFHWKTNEELVCIASWEPKVIDYLNQNKINYEWQSKVFKMPNGKTYRPDLHLTDQNIWIEIKGYFRKDAKQKWDWFQSYMPNSELWDLKKLKSLKIL